jgi:hypothetical protein
VIDIARFIEKEEISATQAKQRRARAITETDCNKESENVQSDPMDVKPMTGPWMHPGEPVILKEETWLEPQLSKYIVREIIIAAPDEEAAKSDAEENDRSNINRRKTACPRTGQNFLQRDPCGNSSGFHPRFLQSEDFWLLNCAILRNALKTSIV